MTSAAIVKEAVKLLDSKKAIDITVMEVGKLSTLGDYFIIASGSNVTQVKSLAEELEDKMSQMGLEPRRIEGESTAMWILMDYNDILIHIFYHETRDFYCLERLWADAPQLDVAKLLES